MVRLTLEKRHNIKKNCRLLHGPVSFTRLSKYIALHYLLTVFLRYN